MDALRRFTATHPVYAECGGMLMLGRQLTDLEGHPHAMAGVLDFSARRGRLQVGYRTLRPQRDGLLTRRGEVWTGHEFHRWELDDDPTMATATPCGRLRGGERKDARRDGHIQSFTPAGFTCTGPAVRRSAPDGATGSQPRRQCQQTVRHPSATATDPGLYRALADDHRRPCSGVGFRASCHRRALELGLRGWVRNRLDGSVEVQVEGPPQDIAELRAWCEKGPPRSQVVRVKPSQLPVTGDDWFEVRS